MGRFLRAFAFDECVDGIEAVAPRHTRDVDDCHDDDGVSGKGCADTRETRSKLQSMYLRGREVMVRRRMRLDGDRREQR